jgi:bifunctional oligoribonuclease and PAP phosphatase NrnA
VSIATEQEQDEVLHELREADKLLLTTHENPDGDALGSLLAMHRILEQLGKDSVMYMSPGEFPLPWEYRGFTFDGLVGAPPDDVAERTIVFLDCGNIDRMPVDFLQAEGLHILNIDHHHDNTRFGTVNLVCSAASSTAEIVWRLSKELGAEITPGIADALYVGLVTDTGRFMYENTGTGAHVMAAELIAAGVDVHEMYRRLYEGIPFGKLELLARALSNVERYDDGRLTITRLSAQDYAETGAAENYSEGVVDHLRSVHGTAVAGLVRDLLGDGQEGRRKVSLRATDERVDVSAIARTQGGGGHRQAAGFSTTMEWPELIAFLRREIAAQLL